MRLGVALTIVGFTTAFIGCSSSRVGSDAGSVIADASDVPVDVPVGLVSIIQAPGDDSTDTTIVEGSFGIPVNHLECTHVPPWMDAGTWGYGEWSTCVDTDPFPGFDGGPAPFGNVGALTVTGGNTPLSILVDGNGYYAATLPSLLWTDGESVRVQAPGVPPGMRSFDITLPCPARITVTSPALTSTMTNPSTGVVLDPYSDLAVSWMAGSAEGTVVVSLWSGSTPGLRAATFSFPVTARTGTIPSWVLAWIAQGQSGFFQVVSQTQGAASGTYPVNVSVLQYPVGWGGFVPLTFAGGSGGDGGVTDSGSGFDP